MKLSEFKSHLQDMHSLSFIQPNGSPVPAHFHITEAGVTTKHFIDCGGTERIEKYVSFGSPTMLGIDWLLRSFLALLTWPIPSLVMMILKWKWNIKA